MALNPSRSAVRSLLGGPATILLVLALVSPTLGVAPALIKTPPYNAAKKILWTSTANRSCVHFLNAANASENKTAGNASVAACARANASQPSTRADSRAGFLIRFGPGVTGTYTVTVYWSIHYSPSYVSKVHAGCFFVVLNVLNVSNGSRFGYGSSFRGCGIFGGSGPLTLSWLGYLVTGQPYEIQTYLEARASASIGSSGVGAYSGSAFGSGTLTKIWIR